MNVLNFIFNLIKRIEYIVLKVGWLAQPVQVEGHRVDVEVDEGQQLLCDTLGSSWHIPGVESSGLQTNRTIFYLEIFSEIVSSNLW